jgi:hypothetical protein
MAVNHADGTLILSVLFYPVAAVIGAASAGAGWLAFFFIPMGLVAGGAVAYASRKFIYGILGFAMNRASKVSPGWVKQMVALPVMILYLLLPYAFVWTGVLDTWYGSIWLVQHPVFGVFFGTTGFILAFYASQTRLFRAKPKA